MPALGATDPANLVPRDHVELGFSRQLVQHWRTSPHPALGGSGSYAKWFRKEQLTRFIAGEATSFSQLSVYQWADQVTPYCNREEWTQIIGANLINLITFITDWPDATLDKMAVFMYNKGGDLYSSLMISKCLKELGVTKQKTSTEAYQVQQPNVQLRHWAFWNCPPPLGVFEVLWRQLIYLDEFGVSLERCNCTGGWAAKVLRV
jgi:hypothetical protein